MRLYVVQPWAAFRRLVAQMGWLSQGWARGLAGVLLVVGLAFAQEPAEQPEPREASPATPTAGKVRLGFHYSSPSNGGPALGPGGWLAFEMGEPGAAQPRLLFEVNGISQPKASVYTAYSKMWLLDFVSVGRLWGTLGFGVDSDDLSKYQEKAATDGITWILAILIWPALLDITRFEMSLGWDVELTENLGLMLETYANASGVGGGRYGLRSGLVFRVNPNLEGGPRE